ncbi:glycerol-3-phosphate 1-O-acyltransferase PlsY [Sporosarcina pasteurii]|uniref:Glycerol-3-phosphate acyltransferase n=1 Tax=Sporosarcina pasteurii TaxID=1474 RepID=A0A380BQH4_SPOPA|nr:glycerol-3-phosphate 1-O-acyltransferase PlsY [Sporosarcina pasteurii]MDS9471164.1 glycerol-3-phosphate 1-O-acyltransferase PlsY [Sporosarcina pasteurii]QBQ05197.1 glycerol-3-phosphate 1-O-acyltransferase PlsY [Sporosarcina pasteurii]SUJ05363.1 G3P acyltransferase [Sporosarcina pasteurii]
MDFFVIIFAAYILGSIPSALWVGKWFYKVDVREHGSGNLGATNTFRVLGKTAGFIVTLLDILKGTVATILPLLPLFSETTIHPLVLGLVSVVGHMYPIFANFKGGKAVATSGGVVLGYHWPVFLLVIIIFFIVLKLSKMVSFTSMTVAIVGFIYSVVYYFNTGDFSLLLVIGLLSLFIFYRHRENIARIRSGTEPKITWLK